MNNSAETVLLGHGLTHESFTSLLQPLGVGRCSVSRPRTLQHEDCRGRGLNHQPSEPQPPQHDFFSSRVSDYKHAASSCRPLVDQFNTRPGRFQIHSILMFQSYTNKPKPNSITNIWFAKLLCPPSNDGSLCVQQVWLTRSSARCRQPSDSKGLMQDLRSTFACFRVIDEDCSFPNLTSHVKNATEDVEKWLDGRGETFLWFLLKQLRIYCNSIVL